MVKNRVKETLIPILILSELSAYSCLKNKNYDHRTVNHSKNIVDPMTRPHTQAI
jgi:hypothetical protein